MQSQLYTGCRLGKHMPGTIPTGKDWLRRQLRVAKYAVWHSTGVLGLVSVRERAPLLLKIVIKPFGRTQLDSVRVAAARAGKVAAVGCAGASWGVVDSCSEKTRGGQGEGRWSFGLIEPISGYLCSRGSACFSLFLS